MSNLSRIPILAVPLACGLFLTDTKTLFGVTPQASESTPDAHAVSPLSHEVLARLQEQSSGRDPLTQEQILRDFAYLHGVDMPNVADGLPLPEGTPHRAAGFSAVQTPTLEQIQGERSQNLSANGTTNNRQASSDATRVASTVIPTWDPSGFFKSYIQAHMTYFFEPDSKAGSPLTYINLASVLEGINSHAEANTDEEMLQWNMRLIDNMISTATYITERDATGASRSHLAWASGLRGGTIEDMREIGTYSACAEIARAAAIVALNPIWKSKYAAELEKFLKFVEDMVITRFYVDTYQSNPPWLSDKVWSEKGGYLGVIATALYQATRKPLHLDLAKRIGNLFKARLQPNGTGWIWDNGIIPIGSEKYYGVPLPNDVGNQEGVPSTGRAGAQVKMMVLMHEAGIVFERQDIDRMANTLTDIMWNGSMTDPIFSNYINGSNKPYQLGLVPGSYGLVALNWGLLSRYFQKAHDALANLLLTVLNAGQSDPHKLNPTQFATYTPYARSALMGDLTRYKLPFITPPPPPVVTCIVNSASWLGGALAPGALATVFGSNLSGKKVLVTFDGLAAKLLYVGDKQINLQIPLELGTRGWTQMVVTVDGYQSASFALPLAVACPGIFKNGILNQDNTLNSESTPAPVGSVVQIFTTGLMLPGGWRITAKLHDRWIDAPDYAGPAPGLMGVQQVNLTIPADLPSMTTEVLVCATNPSAGQQICSWPARITLSTPNSNNP